MEAKKETEWVEEIIPPKEDSTNLVVESTIIRAIKIMERKHDLISAINSIKRYLETNEPAYLTRQENLRESLMNSSLRKDLLAYLNEHSLSVGQYLAYLMRSGKLQQDKQEVLESAVLTTYHKYEELFQLGEKVVSGEDFVCHALERLLMKGSYTGFTREEGVRKNLIENINREEALFLMRSKLSYPQDTPLTMDEVSTLAKEYATKLIQEEYTPVKVAVA